MRERRSVQSIVDVVPVVNPFRGHRLDESLQQSLVVSLYLVLSLLLLLQRIHSQTATSAQSVKPSMNNSTRASASFVFSAPLRSFVIMGQKEENRKRSAYQWSISSSSEGIWPPKTCSNHPEFWFCLVTWHNLKRVCVLIANACRVSANLSLITFSDSDGSLGCVICFWKQICYLSVVGRNCSGIWMSVLITDD